MSLELARFGKIVGGIAAKKAMKAASDAFNPPAEPAKKEVLIHWPGNRMDGLEATLEGSNNGGSLVRLKASGEQKLIPNMFIKAKPATKTKEAEAKTEEKPKPKAEPRVAPLDQPRSRGNAPQEEDMTNTGLANTEVIKQDPELAEDTKPKGITKETAKAAPNANEAIVAALAEARKAVDELAIIEEKTATYRAKFHPELVQERHTKALNTIIESTKELGTPVVRIGEELLAVDKIVKRMQTNIPLTGKLRDTYTALKTSQKEISLELTAVKNDLTELEDTAFKQKGGTVSERDRVSLFKGSALEHLAQLHVSNEKGLLSAAQVIAFTALEAGIGDIFNKIVKGFKDLVSIAKKALGATTDFVKEVEAAVKAAEKAAPVTAASEAGKPITGKGYDGDYTLVYKDSGKPVVWGDVVKSESGDTEGAVNHGEPPHRPGTEGKVNVGGSTYYAKVFGMQWKKSGVTAAGMSEMDSEQVGKYNVRVYDNGGETADRYTFCIVDSETGDTQWFGASEDPFSPQGFGQYVGDGGQVSEGEHLGKKIKIAELPDAVQKYITQTTVDENPMGDETTKDNSEMQPASKSWRKKSGVTAAGEAGTRKRALKEWRDAEKAIRDCGLTYATPEGAKEIERLKEVSRELLFKIPKKQVEAARQPLGGFPEGIEVVKGEHEKWLIRYMQDGTSVQHSFGNEAEARDRAEALKVKVAEDMKAEALRTTGTDAIVDGSLIAAIKAYKISAMWVDRIQDTYDDFEDFLSHDEIYGLAERLGYSTPEDLWDENPYTAGGVDPKDFKKVEEAKVPEMQKDLDDGMSDSDFREKYLKNSKKALKPKSEAV